MKNQEWQFVNLELSIKLKELGVKQDSYWCWVFNKGRYEDENRTYLLENSRAYNFEKENRCWNAYSVAELGILMKDLKDKLFIWNYYLEKRDCFDSVLRESANGDIIWEERAKTEANSKAKMLVYLVENKLIKVEDINK